MVNKIFIGDLGRYKLKGMSEIKAARALSSGSKGDTITLSKRAMERRSLNKFHGLMSQAARKFKLKSAPQSYMDEFMDEAYIRRALEVHNEEISKILGKYGYEPKVEMQHLKDSRMHFITTYNFARNLTKEGGFALSEEDRYNLLEAALLHDVGKALIPTEIFNKPGRFTPDEREVMDLHSEFSYILLKDSGINRKTLSAIRNHHKSEEVDDEVTKILSLCDIVSALKENRVYKPGFKDAKTIQILQEDSASGKLNPGVTETGLNIMSVKPLKPKKEK